MSGVFINYRGEDTDTAAVLIDRELAARFGSDRVFLDSRSIPAGADFVEELLGRLRACSVLLVVIGPRWLSLTDAASRRRIDDPRDWIRREIVEALSRGLRVIPVLTGGVALPAEADLPQDIAELARRQYVPLRRRYTTIDLAFLVERITEADAELAEVAARRQSGTERVPAPPAGVSATSTTAPSVKRGAPQHTRRKQGVAHVRRLSPIILPIAALLLATSLVVILIYLINRAPPASQQGAGGALTWKGTLSMADGDSVDVGDIAIRVIDFEAVSDYSNSFYFRTGRVNSDSENGLSEWDTGSALSAAICANRLNTHPVDELAIREGLQFCTRGVANDTRVAHLRIITYDSVEKKAELEMTVWAEG